LPSALCAPLFYPAWENLPHEAKLPHVDVISERLETLVALARDGARSGQWPPFVVTNVVALLQRTFSPAELNQRTRSLTRGDRFDPLDLIEWLEEQGYEPEAQVTQKGEIALRGGILDVFPPTNPWPARLEFFGDELESLRYFDPLTQISREGISHALLPPAGELGIIKRRFATPVDGAHSPMVETSNSGPRTTDPRANLSTLADYLPAETIFLFCEPEALVEHAQHYARQIAAGDPFFSSWEEFRERAARKGMTALAVCESEITNYRFETTEPVGHNLSAAQSGSNRPAPGNAQPAMLAITSLDAFRPLGGRANSSPNCIAGCVRTTPFTSFAITKANASGSPRSGTSTVSARPGRRPACRGFPARFPRKKLL